MELRDYAGKKIEDFTIRVFWNESIVPGGCWDSSIKYDGKEIDHAYVSGPLNMIFALSYRSAVKIKEDMTTQVERTIRKAIEQRILKADELVANSLTREHFEEMDTE